MAALYSAKVFYPGDTAPRETHTLNSSPAVLEFIAKLVKANAGCDRIEVHAGGNLLFAVDCSGRRLDG